MQCYHIGFKTDPSPNIQLESVFEGRVIYKTFRTINGPAIGRGSLTQVLAYSLDQISGGQFKITLPIRIILRQIHF